MKHLIQSYFQAWEQGSWEKIQTLLDDDFKFTSPDDDKINLKQFQTKCWIPMHAHIGKFDLDVILSDEEGCFVRYSNSSEGRKPIRCAEYFTVKNGKIDSIDVFWGFKAQKAT